MMPDVTIRVRDLANNPVVRRVRLHHRDTGAVLAEGLSNGNTGLVTLNTTHAGPAYAVILDDAAGVIEPDRIVRMVI